jgi:pilus assembly protein CpaC
MSSSVGRGTSLGSVSLNTVLRCSIGAAWRIGVACALVGVFNIPSGPVHAADSSSTHAFEGWSSRPLVVPLYKSRTIHLERPFATAVVGSPDIADVLPMTDRGLYIQGKKIGTTNVSVFDQDQNLVAVIDLEIALDNRDLQSKIFAATGNRGIRVSSSNGQVVLSGQATDAVAADRAVAVARTISPNGVVNAMNVAPSQQVLLKVRFLEASRDAGRDLGVNIIAANANGSRGVTTGQGTFVTNTTGTTPNVTPGGIPLFQTAGSLVGQAQGPFGVVLANLVNNGTQIDVLITALETKGLIRRLAEPTLAALSGDTAQFLAGGEFPVPIAATSANGIVTPTIEYKPFGVRLSFTPTVLAKGVINLRIAPEVSELDFANAVTISGTTVPSLIKRDATTTVELRDGQSFAIAGLLQANDLRLASQVPWLGSVPVLGALFRSMHYLKHETDLVIIVTPHLVQPAVPGQHLATPFDQRIPSNDVDFFVFGQTEIPRQYNASESPLGVQGPYGHIIPLDPNARGR